MKAVWNACLLVICKRAFRQKKALTNLSETNFWSSWGLPILLTHARTTLHADKEESHFYAFSSLDHFFSTGLGLSFLRLKLKYIENKYSTVYLKSTHLEVFHMEVTSKSLDFLGGFPPINVTSSAPQPPEPFPVVYRFRENVLLTQGALDSPRCCYLSNVEYELALSSESFKNTDWFWFWKTRPKKMLLQMKMFLLGLCNIYLHILWPLPLDIRRTWTWTETRKLFFTYQLNKPELLKTFFRTKLRQVWAGDM